MKMTKLNHEIEVVLESKLRINLSLGRKGETTVRRWSCSLTVGVTQIEEERFSVQNFPTSLAGLLTRPSGDL